MLTKRRTITLLAPMLIILAGHTSTSFVFGNDHPGMVVQALADNSGMHQDPMELPLFKDSPVIYDNDDHRDVYTDEYLLALGSLGEIDFKGIITTYSPREYQEFVEGREQIMALAKVSGLKHLPGLFMGTNKKLIRPETNQIEDTHPLEIDGSSFMVEIAKNCRPSKPLAVITGGQLTSIANAYLLDPSIADKVVVMGVFGAELIDYNAGLDAWAWTIILSKFRVVAIPIGPSTNRAVVYMKPPVVPKERIKEELNQEVPFFKWMVEKKHPSNWLPAESDYDGHPAILLTRPDYVTRWNRYKCIGIDNNGRPILEKNDNGHIWQAEDADQQIATNEFWRVMHKLNATIKYDPNGVMIQGSTNGRYLQWSNGEPIYINADTGWSLPRDYLPAEVVEYLDKTKEQRFNAVQMSAVFHAVRANQDIIGPAFYDEDLTKPKQDYWDQVDWVVKEATNRGLIVMINPIWKNQHSNTIQNNGVEKCRAYGKWFAERYKDNPYVIYFVGGDAVPEPVKDELAAMAEGIQEVYNGKAIIAVHSRQTTSSLEVYPEQPAWLTLNWTYAYSPLRADWNIWPYEHNHRNYQQFHLRNYQQLPPVPIQFGEGYYDFGAGRELGITDVADRFGGRYAIRRQAWYASFLTGSTGHAYGAEAIWHHNRDGETWQMALQYDSRKDMSIKMLLINDIPWWTMTPDINHRFLICGFGVRGTAEFAVAAVSSDRKLAVIYTPVNHELQINLDELAEGQISAGWFDPCSGEIKPAEGTPSNGRGRVTFSSPVKNSCGDSDYVLLIKIEG